MEIEFGVYLEGNLKALEKGFIDNISSCTDFFKTKKDKEFYMDVMEYARIYISTTKKCEKDNVEKLYHYNFVLNKIYQRNLSI